MPDVAELDRFSCLPTILFNSFSSQTLSLCRLDWGQSCCFLSSQYRSHQSHHLSISMSVCQNSHPILQGTLTVLPGSVQLCSQSWSWEDYAPQGVTVRNWRIIFNALSNTLLALHQLPASLQSPSHCYIF